MRLRCVLWLVFVSGLAAACAPAPVDVSPRAQRLYDSALDLWFERDIRLQRISQRLRARGVELCPGSKTAILGLVVAQVSAIPGQYQEPAQRRFGTDDRVHVVAVLPGLPAERAGLAPGDVLITIGAEAVDEKIDVYQPDFMRAGPLMVRLERDGVELQREVEHLSGCKFPAILGQEERVRVSSQQGVGWKGYSGIVLAVKKPVVVSNGAMRLVIRDEQIAFLIGHEMGHGIMMYGRKRRDSGPHVEVEADSLGVRLAARAGYVLTAEDFGLMKLASANPDRLVDEDEQHPSSPERELAFLRSLEEANARHAQGESLVREGSR